MGMYTTSSEGRKQHSTCLLQVQTLLSPESLTSSQSTRVIVKDNTLDVNNIKYWIPQSTPHEVCATNGDECIAKYFCLSLKYRTVMKLNHQHASGSKKNSTA